MTKYLMTFDEGTTSARCLIFDDKGQVCAKAQKELGQIFPRLGWVEQDATEIWSTQLGVASEALAKLNLTGEDVAAIGITNQRETTVVWDKATGQPVYNAIVWQCRRTAEMTKKLADEGKTDFFRKKTGLILDPYFSATKIRWILDHIDGGQDRAERGELLFGTIDTWLIYNLTRGKVHVTDYSNASRTMLFNIHDLDWDDEILEELNIPRNMLPEVRPSSSFFGETSPNYFGSTIPIGGVAGDQQAALFGQGCFDKGEAKNTYGTGAFLLMNTGEAAVESKNGLITTIAWGLKEGIVTYALEGSIFVAGSAVQWLRDNLRIVDTAMDTEYMANRVASTDGCYVVPAFTGLGAPYWDPYARGTIVGISRSTNKYHIIRAVLESEAFLSNDVLQAMAQDSKIPLRKIRVDGGGSDNNFLMQFQADISQVVVERPEMLETTALGVAFLAGLHAGVWDSLDDIRAHIMGGKVYRPQMDLDRREKKRRNWKRALERSMAWAQDYEEE